MLAAHAAVRAVWPATAEPYVQVENGDFPCASCVLSINRPRSQSPRFQLAKGMSQRPPSRFYFCRMCPKAPVKRLPGYKRTPSAKGGKPLPSPHILAV